MNQNEALGTLIRAAKVAYTRGAFQMDEAGIIDEAIKTFTVEQSQTQPQDGTSRVILSEVDKTAS